MRRTFVVTVLLLGTVAVCVRWFRFGLAEREASNDVLASVEASSPERQQTTIYARLRPRSVGEQESASVGHRIDNEPSLISLTVTSASFPVTSAMNGIEDFKSRGLASVQPVISVPETPLNPTNLCRSNLHAIVWAANIWAWTNRQRLLPLDLMFLTNELASSALLVCPADPAWESKVRTNWYEFDPQWITYRFHPRALGKPASARRESFVSVLTVPHS